MCGIFFFNEYNTAQEEIVEYAEMQNRHTSVQAGSDNPADGETLPEAGDQSNLPYVAVDFDSLLAINPETVGWIAIPGTEISYPVLQAADNNKYLNTSFSGERSGTGAIFMDCGNSVELLDKNSVLYGHNMGKGRTDMFGSLLEYKDQAYGEAHARIQFDTIYRQYGWWRLFAVINLDAKTTGFDYLKQNFTDDAAFEAWITQAKALSLYDTEISVSPDDKILTLSTCDRSVSKNGRLVVMAVLDRRDDA